MKRPPNPVAVVTGAAQGIGQAFALRLEADGFRVIGVDIQDMDDTLARARSAGIHAMPADISNEQSVTELRDGVISQFGRCDVLVNNAGTGSVRPFEEISLKEWRNVMAVNLDSMFLTCRAFIPGMRANGWGRIINMASNTLGLVIPFGFSSYVASKGGVIGLTRSLASEYGDAGVTVNAISPGLTRTPATVELFGDTDAFAQAQAIRRVEVPEDLAGAMAFLASDDSAFMTGQTLTVDGGLVR